MSVAKEKSRKKLVEAWQLMMHAEASVQAEAIYKLGVQMFGNDEWMKAVSAVIAYPSD